MRQTAIIVLHYNNVEMTRQCINSIINNTERNTFHIFVIDNNSDKEFKWEGSDCVSILRNATNQSVNGMNLGFYHAIEYGYKYIVNFDNDIICLPNWLPPLIKKMESDKTIGIVGGKQWDKDQTCFRSVGMDMMGILYKNHPEEDLEVFWITGSAVMLRAEMMKRIGLHDGRYISICSDSDYCFHALDRGWKVVFVADSNVIHLGSASYGQVYEGAEEDRKQFIRKWFGLKFSDLAKKFPISVPEKRSGYSEFKVIENIKMGWSDDYYEEIPTIQHVQV